MTIDTAKLRELAEAANIPEAPRASSHGTLSDGTDNPLWFVSGLGNTLSHLPKANAQFVAAAANPQTVVALLDRIAALEQQESDDLTCHLALQGDVEKLRQQLALMTAARDEACDLLAEAIGTMQPAERLNRLSQLRKVGSDV